jgi:16S rRNA G966 N2-methylase RsmD
MDRDHHRFIQECVKKLGAEGIIPIRGDVFRFLKSCKQQYDMVFADPPYALKELAQLPDLVMERHLLKEGGIFVLEHGKDHSFEAHPHFVEHRQYGSVNFSIFSE